MPLVSIASIKVGKRYRKKLGDIDALAANIREIGLLQPIGITDDFRLVFGERRLRACRDILKQTKILARIVKVTSILAGEYAENQLRKDFTPSERVAIATALEEQIPERRGNPSIRLNCDELEGRTDEFVASKAGFKNRHVYNRAKKAVRQGSTGLIQAMDEGKVAISTAAYLADAPLDVQNKILELDARNIRQAARTLRRRKKASDASKGDQMPIRRSGKNWVLTNSQQPVVSNVVIVQPPFGTSKEEWRVDELEAFTQEWGSAWSGTGARFIAVFWCQDLLFEGRRWLDETLGGYRFEQLLIWSGGEVSTSRRATCFGICWQPIFLYRQVGTSKISRSKASNGNGRHFLDCHIAQKTADDLDAASDKQPPASVVRWLLQGLSSSSDLITSPFCGTAACGAVALELGRSYHGIEVDAEKLKIACDKMTAAETKVVMTSAGCR